MSSPYLVLDNRPLDQWKVTELKDELKRRKLPLKGLKDVLIKRLTESLQLEKESFQEDDDNELPSDVEPDIEAESDAEATPVAEAEPVVEDELVKAKPVVPKPDIEAEPVVHSEPVVPDLGTVKTMDHGENFCETNDPNVGEDMDNENSVMATDKNAVSSSIDGKQCIDQDEEATYDLGFRRVAEELIVRTSSFEKKISKASENCVDMSLSVHDIDIKKEKSEVGFVMPKFAENIFQKDNELSHAKLEIVDSEAKLEDEGLEHQLDTEDSKPSNPNYQVPEVIPSLEVHIKSDSISNACVSVNEKNELKDDIIVDNLKLELDNVKTEVVQPPSSGVAQDRGKIYSMDIKELHEENVRVEEVAVEGLRENNISIDEFDEYNGDDNTSKINDNVEVVYSEKLNLDRSSGDDSMEEDAVDGKQIDSKYIFDEIHEGNEKPTLNSMEEDCVDVVGDYSSAGEKASTDQNAALPTVKRKLHDPENQENCETSKRQRRWNTENLTVPEPKITNLTPSTTPKDPSQLRMFTRNLSNKFDLVTDNSPKERIVPPSQISPTSALRIDRFLRPFTLKAVHELLAKTGTVTSFWMDQIKTHCYVTFSCVEEAVETRNAVYNLQWPPNGGRLLTADFVDPQEVNLRVASAAVTTPLASTAPLQQPSTPSPRIATKAAAAHVLPPPPPHPPAAVLKREQLPPPPPLPEKAEPPIVTLDDLFRKTRAMPRIYYLPLSEEEVIAKGGGK